MSIHITSFPGMALLALLAFTAVTVSCGTATMKSDAGNSEAVRIDNFELSAPTGVNVGDDITFTVRGTPGGEAAVLITGVPETVYLREIEEGVYGSELTVHFHMQFFPHDFARATLTKRWQTATADQKLPVE